MLNTDNVILTIVAAVIMVLLTALLATAIVSGGWEQDCETLGKHRVNKDVYECRKVSK